MSDLISRKAIMSRIESEYRKYGEEYDAGQILCDIEDFPTAFDLESVIMEIEGISKDMQSEANDLASIGDYGCATKFEGMAQAYKDCVKILKSAANATNNKTEVSK